MPSTEIDGVRIAYQTAGASGSPVLLVMGLSFPGRMWTPQVEALARRHRVAWLDNRGAGGSDAPPGLYTVARMADDARGLLDHLGWRQAHVAGVSMGGMIAQELALRHRPRVRSLALIATHAGGFPPPVPTLEGHRWLLLSHLRRGEASLAATERVLFPPEFLARQDRRALRAALGELLRGRSTLRGSFAQLAGLARHHAGRRLARLAGLPTLIVQPGRDLIIKPKESARLARLIPGAELVRFPDAGHGVTYQCRDEVNRRLLEHFRRADAAAGPKEVGVLTRSGTVATRGEVPSQPGAVVS